MRVFNFICVNYNGAGFCHSLCDSLNKMIVPENSLIRLIVVDNDSEPEDKSSLKKIESGVVEFELIELPKNIGYFPAMNHGIKFARDNGEGFIVIGNNDLRYHESFIANLLKLKLDQKVMVVSPDVVTLDGVHQNPLATSKLSRFQLLVEDIYYSNYYVSKLLKFLKRGALAVLNIRKRPIKPTQPISTQIVIERGIGACYFLTENFFKCYDRLDDRVFMWGEEALLSNQVQKAGGVILYAPSLLVEHFESGTVSKMLTKSRYDIVRQSYRIYREYL